MASKSPLRTRSARRGQLVLETRAGAKAAASLAVAVSPAVLNGLRSHKATVKKVVEGLNKMIADARHSGKTVGFTITVDADGEPAISALAADRGDEGIETEAERDQVFAEARARGRIRAAEILSRDDMLSADQMADRLGISRVTVNARRQRNELLGLDGAKRGFRFPAWQVDEDGKPLDALPQLFERLGSSPWGVYRFLTQRHNALDGATGRDALQDGRTDDVLDAAQSAARGDFS
jgi:hypothetical protein